VIQGFNFNGPNTGSNSKITSVIHWGPLQISNSGYQFSSCTNLDLSAVTDTIDLTGINDLHGMFNGCGSITTINNIGSWNVSNIINMSGMFGAATLFNDNIGSWNVSSVTDMSYMFANSTTFNNGSSSSINGWIVSNVTNMQGMFQSTTAFNQNIGSWNVSGVTNFISFMDFKTDLDYSAANLDSIYNTWSTLTLHPSLNINFGTIKYTSGGSAGRAILTSSPNNWTIADGGI
jgi:surface protein